LSPTGDYAIQKYGNIARMEKPPMRSTSIAEMLLFYSEAALRSDRLSAAEAADGTAEQAGCAPNPGVMLPDSPRTYH
jgi:hypothetical protein